MSSRLIEAKHVRDYILRIAYEDGISGELDLAGELDGEVVEPLRDIEFFKRVRVDPSVHTIVWPNGADFAPEFVRNHLRVDA
jgi:hypothetical protein